MLARADLREVTARARETLGYLVEGPNRLFFVGDTDLFDGMRAAHAAALLEPRVAVPTHDLGPTTSCGGGSHSAGTSANGKDCSLPMPRCDPTEAEPRQRVLSLDVTCVKAARPAPADHSGAVALRAHENEADARMVAGGARNGYPHLRMPGGPSDARPLPWDR